MDGQVRTGALIGHGRGGLVDDLGEPGLGDPVLPADLSPGFAESQLGDYDTVTLSQLGILLLGHTPL